MREKLTWSPEAEGFVLGKYRHYGGGEYQALYVGRHTETLEEVVVYQDLNDPTLVWARPLAMFIEEIEKDGKYISRFSYMGS